MSFILRFSITCQLHNIHRNNVLKISRISVQFFTNTFMILSNNINMYHIENKRLIDMYIEIDSLDFTSGYYAANYTQMNLQCRMRRQLGIKFD